MRSRIPYPRSSRPLPELCSSCSFEPWGEDYIGLFSRLCHGDYIHSSCERLHRAKEKAATLFTLPIDAASDHPTMSPQSSSKQSGRKVKTEKALKSPPSSVTDGSQHEIESVRGRKQDRDSSDGAKVEGGSDDEVEGSSSKAANGQHRKRKRSRKGLDKKYHCPHEACGKSYSRAEHLYRHQLNREFPSPGQNLQSTDRRQQIHQSRFTDATTPIAIKNLSVKTSALAIKSVTRQEVRIYNGRTTTCMASILRRRTQGHPITNRPTQGSNPHMVMQSVRTTTVLSCPVGYIYRRPWISLPYPFDPPCQARSQCQVKVGRLALLRWVISSSPLNHSILRPIPHMGPWHISIAPTAKGNFTANHPTPAAMTLQIRSGVALYRTTMLRRDIRASDL